MDTKDMAAPTPEIAKAINDYLLSHLIPFPKDGICPYCGEREPCIHRDGRSWIKDKQK